MWCATTLGEIYEERGNRGMGGYMSYWIVGMGAVLIVGEVFVIVDVWCTTTLGERIERGG